MWNDDDRKWLYEQMKKAGVDTGTYADFSKSLDNQEDRDWYYQKSRSLGLNVGSADDFAGMMVEPVVAQPQKTEQPVQRHPASVQPAQQQEQPKRVQPTIELPSFEQMAEQTRWKPQPVLERETYIDEQGNRATRPKLMPGFDSEGRMSPNGVYRDVLTGDTYDPQDPNVQQHIEQARQIATTSTPINLEQANRQQVADLTKSIDDALTESRGEAMRIYRENVNKAYPLGVPGADPTEMQFNTRMMQHYGDGIPTEEAQVIGQRVRDLEAAQRSMRDAQRIIDEADHNAQEGTFGKWLESSFAGGAARGFGQKLFDIDTWDMGVSDMQDAGSLLSALHAFDSGKELTESQKVLLDAKAVELATNAYFGSYVGRGYKAGEVTAESIPFMIEMCLNPAAGTGNAAENMLARYAIKRFGKKVVKDNAKKYVAAKVTSRVVGDVAGSAAMAATTGSIGVAADAMNRMGGQVQTDTDEEGQTLFAGHDEGDDFGTAFGKAFAARTIENYSEMVGEYFAPVLGVGGQYVRKGMGKIGLDGVNRFMDDVAMSDVGRIVTDFEKHAKWNGVFGEYAEEVAGGIMNALVVGDQTLDANPETGVFNLDNNIDTFLGVSLMGGFMSAVKTAGYRTPKYRARQDMKAKDDAAAAVFGNQDTWGDIRNTLAFGEDEDVKAKLAEVLTNPDITPEQRAAALEYAQAVETYRGMLRGENRRREDGEADPTQIDAETSFDNGYSLETSQEQNDARNMYEYQQQQLAAILSQHTEQGTMEDWLRGVGDSPESYLEEDPVGALNAIMTSEAWTDEEKQAATDFVNAKATYDGMIQHVQDDMESRVSAAGSMVDSRIHQGDGMIHPATMKVDDRRVYVIGGNVVMNEDGTMIDPENSDESIIIRDAETGNIEFADPHDVLSVDEALDAAQEKQAAQDAIRQEYAQQAADKIDGVLQFNDGDTYTATDEQGQQHTVVVVASTPQSGAAQDIRLGEGEVLVSWDGAEPAPMSREVIQDMVENTNLSRLQQFEQEKAERRAAETEAEREASRPVYNINDEVTLQTDEGQVRGSITAEANEDGLIEVYTERPIGGKKINLYNRDELDAMLVEHNGAQQEVETLAAAPAVDAAGTVASLGENAQEVHGGENGQQTAGEAAGTAAVEPMPMIGEGEDAEPDFSKVEPARAHTFIYNEAGLSRDEANQFVEANKKAADKELEKIQGKKPKMGTSLAKYRKETAEWEQNVTKAQQKADYWKQVKDEQAKIVAAERAAQSERDAQLHEQAVQAEQKRQATVIQQRTEQSTLGVGNAAPSIRDRWQAAPKVEGAQNEIVLANGEKVQGRYMLVESGAATPSHNPRAEFTKNEGFPVDANGQSVNDRDYERDQDAQQTTRQIASVYDQRALQTPVVVSQDGVVLSGNGRTMAGELAAQNGTDGAYIEYLRKYPEQFGFTKEQVESFISTPQSGAALDTTPQSGAAQDTGGHPRVVFVPDEAMPYTAETFAKFNAQEMKGQSKTEQAVKLGKIVDDDTFGRVVRSINAYETLGGFYADGSATTGAINELRDSGAISQAQYTEMFDGDGISAQGREMLENMLIGKAFENNPDAVRQITAFKGVRQSIITALGEISNNLMLGRDYSHESELAQAINLVYQARQNGYKQGDKVSGFARQQNLFAFDEGATVADYTNATVLMYADLLNEGRPTLLKKALALYNQAAGESANGQMDIFSGGVKTQDEILNDVRQLLKYGTEEEQQAALAAAAVERMAAARPAGEAAGTAASISQGERPGGARSSTSELGSTLVGTGLQTDGSTGTEHQGSEATGGVVDSVQPAQLTDESEADTDTPISRAEREVNTSPTPAQKEAGNYKKGHVKIDGFDVTIENPRGSERSGTDAGGREWRQTMHNTYGYIRGTEGVDGDHIDVFLSDTPESGNVYVIDQRNADGSFDEHKVMYGFPDIESARKAYLSNYEDGWQGLGAITPVSKEEFKKWVDSSHRKTKPFAEYKSVKSLGGQHEVNAPASEQLKPTDLRDAVRPESAELGVNEADARAKGVFEYFKGTLNELVELGKKAGNVLQKMVLVPTISERLKSDLSSKGIVLDAPYRHTIDNFAIKHTFNEHASENERQRGQVPITEADFALATDVIENYDEISIDKNNRDQHIILYKKQYPDGRIIYVEEVRSPKKGELAFVSMRKYQAKKSGLPNEAVEASTLGSSANSLTDANRETTPISDLSGSESPEQQALLNGNNPRQYPAEREQEGGGSSVATALDEPAHSSAEQPTNEGSSLSSEGKGTNNSSSEQGNEEKSSFSITPKPYTTKRGKVLDMQLVKFGRELSKEEQRAANKLAKDLKGWWSKEDGGFLMRDVETAQQLAESILDPETVEDAQPMSLSEMAAATDIAQMEQHDETPAEKPAGTVVSLGENAQEVHGEDAAGTSAATESQDTSYGANNALVSRERYEELKRRMRKKMGGQLNMGIDPEILAIGTEMAAFHIEAGARKFAEYAKHMIEDLGDAIRPYLKAFYNGARELPEVEDAGYSEEMTPYDEVKRFDVLSLGGETAEHTIPTVFERAEEVAAEHEAEQEAAIAVEKIKEIARGGQKSGQKKAQSKKKDVSLQQEPDLFGSFGEDANVETSNNSNNGHSRTDAVRSEGLPADGNQQGEHISRRSQASGQEGKRADRGGESRGDGSLRPGLLDGLRPFEQLKGNPAGKPQGTRPAGETAGTAARPTNPKNTHNNHAERGTDYAPKGADARIDTNIKAIELMQQLMESGEQATPEQMKVLRQFSGWGGLGKAFSSTPQSGAAPNTSLRLRELLSEEAYQQANMSRNSAYYTPAGVIDALWDIARAMGFKGGKVLEGSAGIGNILGLMPTDMSERSDIHAVEIDGTTGNILSLLYPDAKVDVQGFEATQVENGSVDLAITNVPYVTGLRVNDTTGDKDLSKKFHDIHDFCIAKNIRKLREGGIGIFITSSSTLDNSARLREWIIQDGGADVVGAFRLNNETFSGTGATSDIIVVRKRVNGKKSPHAIDVLSTTGERTAEYDTGESKRVKGQEIPIIKQLSMDYNSYFVEHPEMMAGEMLFGFEKGDTFRPTSKALYPAKGKNQAQMLNDWAKSFEEKNWELSSTPQSGAAPDTIYEELGEGVKEGSMVVSNGQLCIAQRGKAVPLAVNANKVKGHTKVECFNAYKGIKDALSAVLEYQTSHDEDNGLNPLLKRLNKAYDDFVNTYGHLHRNTSITFLRSDVDFPNILALEKFSERGDVSGKRIQEYGKTDIFSQRVVSKEKEPEPTNVKDAVIASIFVHGRIDVPWIVGKLSGQTAEHTTLTEEQVRAEIVESGLGFENPATRQMEVSYEYLSGNVREKLAQAQANNTPAGEAAGTAAAGTTAGTAAAGTVAGRYDANIKALERVIPMNIPAHLIDFSIGSSWIAPKLYEEYVKEKTDIDVTFTAAGGTWFMRIPGFVGEQKNRAMGIVSEMLHKTIMGTTLIEAAMQNRTITVSETHKKWDGSTETITDKEATQACANKIDEIRADFKDWARAKMQSDPAMAERIERIYNDMFNNYVPRSIPDEFVPDHFPGAVHQMGGKPFSLRPHQGKAVVRGTTQPLLLAHEVGTGKTYTLISTAMEMRRLGTARKPMIVVQNATVGQFVESAKALYPNAKVLTLEDRDHTGEGRKNFYAKIKYNDWDMIVVPQSVFERIPDSDERQMAFVQDKIEEKMLVLEQMRDADPEGSSMIVKQAEKEIAKLEDELADLTGTIAERRKSSRRNREAQELPIETAAMLAVHGDGKKEAVTRQNAEVKALEMLDRQTDDVENFDDMGIDAILVDEAHEYKHLGFATAMQRGVKGVDPSYSKKAQGVYLKAQAVLEKNNGRNVVFATGTPISNTAAEIWTFMRYLMPADTMKEYGIYYFDDFVRNFGNLTQMLEFTTSGKFKENNRFAGYVNLPELVRIWAGVADTVLTNKAGGVNDKIPDMEGGKAQDIYLPQTRALRSVMKYVKKKLDEYDNMSGKEKKENSHIPLTMYGIAKAAAVDARLVVSDAADEPQSKTNEAVRQTLRSLEETADYKGTVALFADNYQNKRSGFNLYEDIRQKLIAAGVPAEQIVVMKSGMSVKKKLEIFDKVNRGEVRVIMGSTFTLGTGVNIQERLHTLIHLDAPNRPMDYTQRNGRILRQGNLHKQMGKPVRVLRFGVEDSLDVTAYQRLKTKGTIADSIMNGKQMMSNLMENRALEEEEDVFGDTVAQLSGSEYAMLKNQAEKDVRKYEAKRKQYEADQTYCHNEIPRLKAEIRALEQRIQQNRERLDVVSTPQSGAALDTTPQSGAARDTSIHVGKLTFASVEAMADYIKEYNRKIKEVENDLRDNPSMQTQTRKLTVTIDLGGKTAEHSTLDFVFTTEQSIETKDVQGELFSAVRRKMTYSCEALGLSDVPVRGALLREGLEDIVENVMSGNDFRDIIERAERGKERAEKSLEQVQERDGKPFEFDKELEQAHERFDEYAELMKKELEDKEKKYAELDADVEEASDITEAEEAEEDEGEDEDSDTRFRDGDDDIVTNDEEDADVRFREVEDEDLAEWLESQPTVKVYRSMVLIDGKLYPPMSSKEADGKQLRQPSELGKWEESEEAPEKAVRRNGKWYFPLRKDNGKMLYAAYNPYIHTSRTMLNDQFSEAQDRDNLVVVEMEVPVSELASNYRADRAKDTTGVKQWKAGVIQGQLSGTREVILTRWAKPVRIVPVGEVADHIAAMLSGQVETMPTNVVTPQQQKALEARGVKFVKTTNQGKIAEGEDAGKTWASVYGKKTQRKTAGHDSREREGDSSGKTAGRSYEEGLASARRSGYSKRQYDALLQRNERRGRQRIAEVLERLRLTGRVTIMENSDGLKGRKGKAKGWFDAKTGKIVVVLSNHHSVSDVVKTILHEGVGHYGLRALFGQHFDQFLDNVFQYADRDVRQRIVDLAKKHDWDFREATEEYLAGLAENTDFERADRQGWWSKIKSLFLDMLYQIGLGSFGRDGIATEGTAPLISDNELRYILWRSYENLAEPGRYRNPFREAEDISMQMRLKVGNFDRERARIHSLGRIDSSRMVAADAVADSGNPAAKPQGTGLRFRDGDFSERDRATARRSYERMVSSGLYQFQEAVQDSMLGLRKVYEAILSASQSGAAREIHIEDVAGHENAYLAENRMSSVNAAEQHDYYHLYMSPLLAEIGRLSRQSGRKRPEDARSELSDYMMAKHGLERNRVFAERDFAEYQQQYPNGTKTLADFRERDYSGLTALTGEDDVAAAEAAAQQIVDDYEAAYDTQDLWDLTREATQATLEKIYRSGLLSKERYEQIRDMFEYYIPLQGWDETTSDKVYGYLTSKNGPLGGSPIKHAVGRSSKADDPIATIARMADDAIRMGNRNLMKQRFLNFVLNNPSDLVSINDLWLEYDAAADEWIPVFADLEDSDTADDVERKVEAFEARMEQLAEAEPDRYKRGRDAENIPYKVVKGNLKEHQVLVRRGGRTYVLTINGNPRAAQALNGLTNPDVNTEGIVDNMLKAGEWVNRHLSAFYTTRNPDFVVSNFFRDMLYSNCMAWVKESPRYALRFHKNFGKMNPAVMRKLLGEWESGMQRDVALATQHTEPGSMDYYRKMFYQFMMNGGETGYTSVRDIEAHKKEIAKELKKQGSVGRQVWSALGMQLDLLNRSVENCARFAAFVTSREMGRSLDRSIYDAKEVSVNFNKKGSGGKMVNATGQTLLGKVGSYVGGGGRLFYVFWNAGVQGLTNFGRAGKRHKGKAIAGATTMFMLGYVIPQLAAAMGGGDGDDDDKNAYYNLPEYVRRSNICFRVGGQWVTIPLPIEFRSLYGLGELASGVISGNEHYSNKELSYQIASQVSQILPLDMLEGGGGVSPFIPSSAKPLVEAYIMNKGWTGIPIYKDTPWNKNDPEWTKAYKNADQTLVGASRWLNEATGGDEFKKGVIDINPAKLEYLLNGVFGGYTNTVGKLKKMGETAFGDREFDWRNMLLANRVVKSGDERTANRKLQNEYFKYKKEYEETRRLLRKYEDAADEGIAGMAERADFLYNSKEYLRYELFDKYKAYIDDYREVLQEETDEGECKEIEAEMYATMRELIDLLHETE